MDYGGLPAPAPSEESAASNDGSTRAAEVQGGLAVLYWTLVTLHSGLQSFNETAYST